MVFKFPVAGPGISINDSIIPQPGLPEGVLTICKKEFVRVLRPSGSPATGHRLPPELGYMDIDTEVFINSDIA